MCGDSIATGFCYGVIPIPIGCVPQTFSGLPVLAKHIDMFMEDDVDLNPA